MKSCWLVGLILASAMVSAAELPVRDGLIFQLDAGGQRMARENAMLPRIGNGMPVDMVLETSRAGSRSVQPVAGRRPVLKTREEAGYFEFDGQDDFLLFSRENTPVSALTVFIMAAPKTNAGNFSAFFSAASAGRNDYTSGLNFDFGPGPTEDLSVLNVESPGAGGFADLLTPGFFNAAARPFGDFHVFTVRSKVGKAGVEVFLDGFKGGERDRTESEIALEQVVIGGRMYSNDGNQLPYVQGHFAGTIAEVLVYDRALSEEERQAIEQWLLTKKPALQAMLRGMHGHALVPVHDPPMVQMLVPGFTVHELPLRIGNLNNVRYRADGKLVGLGYDGRIHLLSDRDGDGLEETAEIFYDKQTLRGPIGMALTAAGDPKGEGLFVASKGKISLILDRDRDGKADEEQVLASGWPELPHGVDTLGVAVDPKDGSIYFGLGCANFVDAYQIDPGTGRSRYDLGSIRGTIQRLSADLATQETICTGVRFTCALAFNGAGDLFATDQEGATWLSNGNPLDELLHIERGKHYGFPPRHPKHLPGVRDQPAVIEIGPQHQSTVGLVFNEGVNGGRHFGPAHWQGDAMVCGAARGKIWRVKLARAPLGYVAEKHLIASLGALAIDSCVSPQGDLVVACHSGPPDWGTGPAGEGRIFKIQYTGRDVPKPVRAWAAGPDEFRIGFDRALEPGDWAKARERVTIEAGEFVRAGDRFEVVRPGYQIVRDQMAEPRRKVEVLGLTLSEDRRMLVLRVPRQTEAVHYAITLPTPSGWMQSGGISQHPQMDLSVTLNGVAAVVSGGDGREVEMLLPHPSLAVSATLLAGMEEQVQRVRQALASGAGLTLRGAVDVTNPFTPAAQPGSKLDWDMKADPVASAVFELAADDAVESKVELESAGTDRMRRFGPVRVNGRSAEANGLYLRRGEVRHVLSTARVYVPWAAERVPGSQRDLAGARGDVKGNWLRGRRVFFQETGCATCHTIRGEGIGFGPDLSNLIHRDRGSVWQDILQPSATINPDHVGTRVTLNDGAILTGIARQSANDQVVLSLPAAEEVQLARSRVRTVELMPESLMPAGTMDALSAEQQEDLLTFLLSNPLEPAPISRTDPAAPAARRMSEVVEVLGRVPVGAGGKKLRILLCAGPKDHGLDEHDYPLWLERWARLLALADNVEVTTSMGFPAAGQLEAADVAVFCNANPGWNGEKAALLDQFHGRGGGAVYIHYAVDGGADPTGAAERIGLAFTLGSRFRHGDFDLVFENREHPITRGFSTLRFADETYWNMKGDLNRLNILAGAVEEGAARPQLWTLERQRSRIVGCIPGHYTWTFDDPLFRVLVLRSICWAAREEQVDRLAELALVGARVSH